MYGCRVDVGVHFAFSTRHVLHLQSTLCVQHSAVTGAQCPESFAIETTFEIGAHTKYALK